MVFNSVHILVFAILLNFLETRDWKHAFLSVIPPRKGPVALDTLGASRETKSPRDATTESPSDAKDIDYLVSA
jgi:hypothetical protein